MGLGVTVCIGIVCVAVQAWEPALEEGAAGSIHPQGCTHLYLSKHSKDVFRVTSCHCKTLSCLHICTPTYQRLDVDIFIQGSVELLYILQERQPSSLVTWVRFLRIFVVPSSCGCGLSGLDSRTAWLVII